MILTSVKAALNNIIKPLLDHDDMVESEAMIASIPALKISKVKT